MQNDISQKSHNSLGQMTFSRNRPIKCKKEKVQFRGKRKDRTIFCANEAIMLMRYASEVIMLMKQIC